LPEICNCELGELVPTPTNPDDGKWLDWPLQIDVLTNNNNKTICLIGLSDVIVDD
jgi:hypothetical protein